ncbi:hypothetical protein [Phreatobacter oligotrophus]|uniref:hypothetical protein n=1 Tax=Phreatobacter oligotrophus TaxID=1122261 RepID=UPI0023557E85|nr:hypothetical protein [Phreatobacter oligotrophus]MBX9990924.1 hypothetical protein [Phreatobacter oligotrophus]
MEASLNNVTWFVSTYWAALSIVCAFGVGSLFNPVFAHYLKNRENKLLEDIKAAIRASEESVKDNIRRNEAESAAFRHLVTSQHSARSMEIEKRRIQALEAVWAACVALAPQKVGASVAETLKLGVMIQTASQGGADAEKVKQVAEIIWTSFSLDKIREVPQAGTSQLFVPDNVWSKYALYRQLLGRFIIQIGAAKFGVKPQHLVGPEKLIAALCKAMPSWEDYINKHGEDALPYLVEPLETAILTEIQKELAGQTADEDAIRRARIVLDLSSQYDKATKDADVKGKAGQ